jgi:DNA-binding MarR family transcriptional regulator
MASAKPSKAGRLGVGQLLVRLLYEFRQEAFEVAAQRGYDDIRAPHLHIFANIRRGGVRLTELAARAQLSLASTSEFVTELEELGYLERHPDPADRRAKLIFPTRLGKVLFKDAGRRVADIEAHWASFVGSSRFEEACETLQEILDGLVDHERHSQHPETENSVPSMVQAGAR